ncbi:MAG: hypothetical protein WCJ62_08045 [Flavobacterium sp.]
MKTKQSIQLMKSKVYIIGVIPSIIDNDCHRKFYKTQLDLIEMGYQVTNPIDRLTNSDMIPEIAERKNLQDLMMADAVYILPDVPMGKDLKNVEVKLALDLNLTIILGSLNIFEKNSKNTIEETNFNQSLICI